MAHFGLIFVCIAAGLALRRAGRFGADAAATLSAFVVYISLPALILVQVPKLVLEAHLDAKTLVPVSMAWLAFFVALAFVQVVGRRVGWSLHTMGALVLTIGLGNTSFVGYPLVEALLGPDALRYAILADQPGSFVVLATVGMAAGMYYARIPGQVERRTSLARTMARRVFAFPPTIALFCAGIWAISGTFSASGPAFTLFDKLAATLVPVALVTVGAQLRVDRPLLAKTWGPLTVGLVMKLLVLPALFLGLYVYGMGARDLATHVTLLESAMSPMVTGAVLAAELGLDAELASAMVGVGIPLSLVTVPLWNVAFEAILRGKT